MGIRSGIPTKWLFIHYFRIEFEFNFFGTFNSNQRFQLLTAVLIQARKTERITSSLGKIYSLGLYHPIFVTQNLFPCFV